ncbi:hypothetical protein [Sorangium sp. So ce1099]|uniref:hypothetical protein n=1 Tax=Sorangium sp. So ce1099 TaxID=3133331 RepID=UPI003F63416D
MHLPPPGGGVRTLPPARPSPRLYARATLTGERPQRADWSSRERQAPGGVRQRGLASFTVTSGILHMGDAACGRLKLRDTSEPVLEEICAE